MAIERRTLHPAGDPVSTEPSPESPPEATTFLAMGSIYDYCFVQTNISHIPSTIYFSSIFAATPASAATAALLQQEKPLQFQTY
jgi:hypothetical protein